MRMSTSWLAQCWSWFGWNFIGWNSENLLSTLCRWWFHERCTPTTFALEAQAKSQSTPNLNLCLALTDTYIHILIYPLILTRTCAYTLNYLGSNCRWRASVRGASFVLLSMIHTSTHFALFHMFFFSLSFSSHHTCVTYDHRSFPLGFLLASVFPTSAHLCSRVLWIALISLQ
jgi:hypothetical protein